MTTSDTGADQEWGQIAALDAPERESRMQARYQDLATLPEDERRQRLRAMAQTEYALPDDELRSFTYSRLRVWLDLDPTVARQIAASYDAVMSQMPGPIAMRRVGIVQTLAKEFPPEDEERLRELVPAVFAGQPHRVTVPPPQDVAPPAQAAAPSDPAPRSRPWWAFWKRDRAR
jgi:hypothetical protein